MEERKIKRNPLKRANTFFITTFIDAIHCINVVASCNGRSHRIIDLNSQKILSTISCVKSSISKKFFSLKYCRFLDYGTLLHSKVAKLFQIMQFFTDIFRNVGDFYMRRREITGIFSLKRCAVGSFLVETKFLSRDFVTLKCSYVL